MALNPPLTSTGEPCRVEGEYFVMKRKGVEFEFNVTNGNKYTGKGYVILTTCRIVAVNNDIASLFKSFDIPLGFLTKEEFKQPIFGANYIGGTCKPLFNILPGDIKFKIWFMEGGCGTLAPAFLNMVHSMRKNQNKGIDQKMMSIIASGQFAKTAYIDPNDPSVIFLEQPDIPNQNPQNFNAPNQNPQNFNAPNQNPQNFNAPNQNTQNFNAPNQVNNPSQNFIQSNQGFPNNNNFNGNFKPQPQSFQGNNFGMNGMNSNPNYVNNPSYQNNFSSGSNPSYVNPNFNHNSMTGNSFQPTENFSNNLNPNSNFNPNTYNNFNPNTNNNFIPNTNPNTNLNLINSLPNNSQSNQIDLNSYPSLNDIDTHYSNITNSNPNHNNMNPPQSNQIGQPPQMNTQEVPPQVYPNNDIQNMNNVNLSNQQQNNPKYFGFWGPELKKNN